MDARSSASSPYQSLGDRPEMELDLWEGQFNLSSLAGAEDEDLGLGAGEGQEDMVEMYSRGATCWGEDSSVTMGTVRGEYRGKYVQPYKFFLSGSSNARVSGPITGGE